MRIKNNIFSVMEKLENQEKEIEFVKKQLEIINIAVKDVKARL